jgi:hypothetical protein
MEELELIGGRPLTRMNEGSWTQEFTFDPEAKLKATGTLSITAEPLWLQNFGQTFAQLQIKIPSIAQGSMSHRKIQSSLLQREQKGTRYFSRQSVPCFAMV